VTAPSRSARRARSDRAFRVMLHAFPRPFRDVYAEDMRATFHDRLDDARRRGRLALARAWLRTSINVMAAGLKERRRSSLTLAPDGVPPAPTPRGHLMNGWTQDLRHAFRRLMREPAYASFVVLTLALGIAANVAVFTIVDGVLLTALPYDQPDRLVFVWGKFLPESGFDFPKFSLSAPELLDYRAETRSMSAIAGWLNASVTVGGPGEEPERASVISVTPNLFGVLRVAPWRGRLFNDADRQAGPGASVILSHALWQRRFGGRDDVVGTSVLVNGTPRTVIGVMPTAFTFFPGAMIFTPYVIDPANPGNRQGHSTLAIARLADGVSFEQASQEMTVLMRGWRERFPTIHNGHFLYLVPILEETVGSVRTILRVLLGATAALLLIVCANVASLVVVRAERRSRELAIRVALGSGQWRLVRLAAVESGLLALVAGVAGTGLAWSAIRWITQVEGLNLPRISEIHMDARVWIFACAISILTVCLLGVLPSLRARTRRLVAALRLDTRTSSVGRPWVRQSLVTLEVALATVLVIGAALMVQSFSRMLSVDTGFRTDHLLLANVALPQPAYADDGRAQAFFDQAVEGLAAVPGVTYATLASSLPFMNNLGVWDFAIEARPKPAAGQPAWNAPPVFVRAGFFEALGIRLVRGRVFTAEDRAGTEPVAVITDAFERKFFAGEDAIGRRIKVAGNTYAYARIVGIAADLRDQALGVAPRPMYFFPHAQAPAINGGAIRQVSLVLRTDGDPTALTASVRSVVRGIDASLPVYAVQTFDAAVAGTVAQSRFTTLLLALFAVFGFGLGVLGVYGVLAYTVSERTHELGIRRALGAPVGGLARLVLRQGLAPVLAGLAIGMATAVLIAFGGAFGIDLFEISPTDHATYALVAAGILVAALAACLVPLSRALRVSPLVALREM
jgi:putative ABC transport system permease protein